MSKLKMFALATVAVLGLTGSANAATPMLETGDFVGISFLACIYGYDRNYSILFC